jgi:hypothetical protein
MKRSLCEDCGWIAALRAPFGADYWALASLRSKWQSCAATGHHIRVYRTIIPAGSAQTFGRFKASVVREWSILLTLGGYSNMDLSCVRFVDV